MERQEIIESLRKKLLAAISMGDFQKVKEYIEEADHRHIKNEILNDEKYSMNPMHSATYIGNLKVLQFLCDSGADVNTTISSRYLSTPLHIAAIDGKLEIAQFLLDCGANINATNYKGFTPLHLASFYCRPDIVKLLLFNNADTSIKDMNSKTALDVVGGYRRDRCNSNSKIQEIESVLSSAANLSLFPTKAIKIELEASNTTDLASSTVNSSFTLTRENFKEASSTTSSAVKSSSSINSIFSWVRALTTATLNGLFSSSPALLPAQQAVARKIDFNGTALLADVVVRKFTREKYSMPLDDSFLTIEQIKERKLNSLERNIETALSKCEKLYQCPGSSLSNSTTSKGIYQKSL
ncbi:MAG: ankyrin repeat domain-containing protein [Wolbachia endosymbiont of Armadillidium vulgare]|nr:Ankyrin repeats (3 copies) [Wolbachia endosymbiont of Armadillidium vulgare]OJH33115.1 Ankyrin repeats (3 copies) [Wolbachia endosymbiont of Armadillidium vulgare]